MHQQNKVHFDQKCGSLCLKQVGCCLHAHTHTFDENLERLCFCSHLIDARQKCRVCQKGLNSNQVFKNLHFNVYIEQCTVVCTLKHLSKIQNQSCGNILYLYLFAPTIQTNLYQNQMVETQPASCRKPLPGLWDSAHSVSCIGTLT